MVRKRVLAGLLAVAAMGVPGMAGAQDDISISIDKHAQLTGDGAVTYTVRIACGPLPGTADFREGLAGAGQERTGAAAEGGLGPDVVCDGVERTYTAGVSLITEAPFKRGPAVAHVTVFGCNTVGDGQVCIHESAERRIIISGPVPR